MRNTLTLAVALAGLGGIAAVAQALREPEPVTRAHDRAGMQLAYLAEMPEHAEVRVLSYEPSRREREGDDDEQDEPKR